MQKCMATVPDSTLPAQRSWRHNAGMSRRQFLSALSSAGLLGLLGACTPAAPARAAAQKPRAKIRAICFDLFTIFDPRSVVSVAASVVGPEAKELCAAWRVRQFEYSWIHTAAGHYADFHTITGEALSFAAEERKLALSLEQHRTLVDAYSRLEPWPDTRAQLLAWKSAGLALAPLSNYTPAMLEALISHAGLSELFARLISTDAARTFKPSPAAYALGPSSLGLERDEIAFAAFGGWDAAGAKWFGFPTFWVNRLGVTPERLAPPPDATGPDMAALAAFVAG
jgi:2-haloacid dehalogenase